MNEQKRNRQSLTSLILVLCIVASIFIPNIAAAETVPKELKTVVAKVLKAIKKDDDKILSKYCADETIFIEDNEFSEIAEFDDLTKFMSDNMKKMKYSVKSYGVKGNIANVKVKFKYIDASEFSENYIDLLYLKAMDKAFSDDTTELSDKEIAEIIKMAVQLSDCSSYKTETITIKFKKYGTKWKMVEYSEELLNIASSNIFDSLFDYLDELLNEMLDFMDDAEE